MLICRQDLALTSYGADRQMKALFLGNVAADTANGISAELPPSLEVKIVADPHQLARTPEAATDAEILVSNHWRAEYPPIPLLRFVQSVECWSGRIASARLKQTFASVPRGGRAGFRAGRRMARCSAAPSGSSGSAASGRRSRAAPLPSAAMSSLPKKSAFICRSAP